MTLIVQNLVQNGLKFSEDGIVKIEVTKKSLSFATKGDPLMEPIWKYFEPFYKENSTRNSSGTGLGLYISKKAAESLGFYLDYKSINGSNMFIVKL